MAAPIAVQLYTVREAAQADYAGTLRKIAEMGFVGVETAGFPGMTPEEAGKLYKELGLEVVAAHSQLPVGDRKNEIIETMSAIGCKRIVQPAFGKDHYQSINQIKCTCELFNEAADYAAKYGISIGTHNHWWEYEQVEGRYIYEVMRESLEPNIFFELDTYWVKVAGHDPVEVIKQMGNRAPLLHIKDGPADAIESDMVAVGNGVMDWDQIIPAAESSAEWLIVELDRCATDMLEAVQQSYNFLTSKGFARGNKN
jgi:sugar phosphate isomerase/epimerase